MASHPLQYKDRFIRPDLADSFAAMAEAEQTALDAGGAREEGLQAVRDYFYTGPIADAIVAFHEKEDGLFTKADSSKAPNGPANYPVNGKRARRFRQIRSPFLKSSDIAIANGKESAIMKRYKQTNCVSAYADVSA